MVHFLLKRCKYLNFAVWRHISARLAGFKAKSRAGGAANRAAHDPEKVADFSDKIMRKIQNERFRFNLIKTL